MSRLHDKVFPGESQEYRTARDRLLEAEIELRQRIEEVAAQRRALPPGGPVPEDYRFDEADPGGGLRQVRLSELFGDHDSLLLYHFMYGPDWEKPCPMCTSIVDGWSGNAAYIRERAGFAVVSRASADRLAAWATQRGWRNLHLVSSANNSFSADFHSEFDSNYGNQHPVLHVFQRDGATIRHFWTSELVYAQVEGQQRHLDLTWPLWNLLDMTREGRGTDWYPAFQR